MSPPNLQNDHFTSTHRSLLVTVSARALGSVGFGLSILAIWLRWLVPFTPSETPPVRNSQRRQRLSASTARLIASTSRLTSSTVTSTNLTHHGHPKHISFADTPASEQTEGDTYQGLIPILSSDLLPDRNQETLSSVSPTIPESNPINVLLSRETRDDSVDSDSSSRRSSLSGHLPKLVNPFSAAGKRYRGSGSPAQPTYSSESSRPMGKVGMGLPRPWSGTRNRRPSVVIINDPVSAKSSSLYSPFRRNLSVKTPTSSQSLATAPSPAESPSTSRFARKSHRRGLSTPVPIQRTLPYEAPYFATPPISHSSKYAPQTGNVSGVKSITESNVIPSEGVEFGRRDRDSGSSSVETQSLLAPRRSRLTKRRSASEGWEGDGPQRTAQVS